ncbi:enoyl-CoA hydratase/isomerase family protein [Devosia sp. SL43]|uniref:enoyl-CoA hydratase/isomerase family protein n=1 Tax=Devosia sp. SL43 TaxID=2806348 RepID=UPI001F3821B6|nr:enoyl-CoA hydratase/isomerase family protein [Devosia sp. SL43]UJW87275.1 enoyl-CoA hydratase/isomerase family protein [Devosia sp. SL43]
MSERISLAVENAAATLTVDRPDKLNAFDLDMLRELAGACDRIDALLTIRAVILTGAGKAFSAGGDIKAWGAMSPEAFGFEWVRFGHRVFDRLAGLRVPVIAALNGHALGGGLELAGAADIRIAERHIKIGLPETGLGMIPGWSGTQRLARRFGTQVVRRMVLGGETLTAEEALSLGVVDHVVDSGASLAFAQDYAAAIARRGGAAVQTAKLLIALAEGEGGGSAAETLGSILVGGTVDRSEGVTAFAEKRQPNFKGDWS